MNKKLLFVGLLAFLLIPSLVFADATNTTAGKARASSAANNMQEPLAIGNVSNGNTAFVDSRGALSTFEYVKTISGQTGKPLNDGVAITSGASRLATVTISGPDTSAGDYILIYDAASATGTPKIEITVGTAKETVSIEIPGGAAFATGIFADSNSNFVFGTFTYDE